ncbi:MAG: large subunit ribosomal protein [Thermotogaceae bacterium]|jgi:large subunit ribosomal protein L28|nr:large subunit ribosomal protein [Thermotogaceae bacterium]MDN5337370.1 large subunit ribosomal protein [Thermotogaceae bacterium]
MSKKCYVCGKGPATGNNVSHSNKRTKRRWEPNLQRVKVEIDGQIKRVRVCTDCLKSGKVVRAI